MQKPANGDVFSVELFAGAVTSNGKTSAAPVKQPETITIVSPPNLNQIGLEGSTIVLTFQ